MRSDALPRGAVLAVVFVVTWHVALGAVPSAPVSLAAQVTGSTVTLTWTPPAIGPVLAYRLEAGSASGLSNLANTIVGATPSFTATLVPNGTYFIRVRAI